MYKDEYPGGFSPERAIIKYLSEEFPNTLKLSREKDIVVITMDIPEADENTDYIKSLINEKHHVYRQICSDVPHRGKAVSISLRFGITNFDFIINESGSTNSCGFKNLSNFEAGVIYYLYNSPKNKFRIIPSIDFTTSDDAFKITLKKLMDFGYVEVENLDNAEGKYSVKLISNPSF